MEVAKRIISGSFDSQKSSLVSVIYELLLLKVEEGDIGLVSASIHYIGIDLFLDDVLFYGAISAIL